MKTTVTTIAALMLLVSIAAAQDVSKLPGYVDLSSIKVPTGAEAVQEIDLGPDLLAAAFKSDEMTAATPGPWPRRWQW